MHRTLCLSHLLLRYRGRLTHRGSMLPEIRQIVSLVFVRQTGLFRLQTAQLVTIFTACEVLCGRYRRFDHPIIYQIVLNSYQSCSSLYFSLPCSVRQVGILVQWCEDRTWNLKCHKLTDFPNQNPEPNVVRVSFISISACLVHIIY